MGYIDADYYNNVFKGEPTTPENLDKFIERASDLIDQLTTQNIVCIGFDNLPTVQQNLIEKATAYQVEFYILNGGDSSINSGSTNVDNVRIGSFSYQTGTTQSGATRDSGRVSPTTLTIMQQSGLLYQGVGSVDPRFPWGWGC